MKPPRGFEVGSPRTAWVRAVATKTADFSPTLTEQDQRLSLAIYAQLRLGEPAKITTLAENTGVARTDIDKALDAWPGVCRNEAGDIVGYWGLSIEEMAHSIRVDGRKLWAWCAWDTLFLPELLNASVDVTSKDPCTGNPIRLTVTPKGIERCEASPILMSCLVPDESMAHSVVSSFCCHIHFFESAESATAFTDNRSEIFLMTLQEAVLFARLWNHAQYSAIRLVGA